MNFNCDAYSGSYQEFSSSTILWRGFNNEDGIPMVRQAQFGFSPNSSVSSPPAIILFVGDNVAPDPGEVRRVQDSSSVSFFQIDLSGDSHSFSTGSSGLRLEGKCYRVIKSRSPSDNSGSVHLALKGTVFVRFSMKERILNRKKD
jgi:hypothetical protein